MPCRCGREHPESGHFYVTARDGKRTALLAGPYETHEGALDALPKAKHAALEASPEAAFAAFGTSRFAGLDTLGRFNEEIDENA